MFEQSLNNAQGSTGFDFDQSDFPATMSGMVIEANAECVHIDDVATNEVPAVLASIRQSYQDGDLDRVNPSLLLDMPDGNIRKRRSAAAAAELKDSMAASGVLQPVCARPHPTKEGYLELLAGYGRRDTAIELGLSQIPVLVRLVDDQEAMRIHLEENAVRSDLAFGDEIRFVRRWISLFHGDRHSALSASGWSNKKFNERAELLKATDEVLDALDDAKITVRHALILSSFDAKVQNNTLAKVINEKWSVEVLKQRADKVVLPLTLAIFNKNECSLCPHNTAKQANLFDFGEVVSGCAKSSCFHSKTALVLADRRQEAEERFGRVIMMSESVAGDRVTVTPAAVGQEQFDTGCTACSDKIVVINDSIGTSTGQLVTDQCANKSCYSACVKSHQASVDAAKVKETTANETKSGAQASTGKAGQSTKTKAASTAKVTFSQSALEAHQGEIKALASAHLGTDPIFAEALKTFALINLTGFKSKNSSKNLMSFLMARTIAELQDFQEKITKYALESTSTFASISSWDFLKVATLATPTGKETLLKQWEPVKATIERYTTPQLEMLVKTSGLAEFSPESAKKALSGNKAGLVEFIVKSKSTGFDWSHFASPAFVKELERP
jgi:PRTRC genetic system ParB family protein